MSCAAVRCSQEVYEYSHCTAVSCCCTGTGTYEYDIRQPPGTCTSTTSTFQTTPTATAAASHQVRIHRAETPKISEGNTNSHWHTLYTVHIMAHRSSCRCRRWQGGGQNNQQSGCRDAVTDCSASARLLLATRYLVDYELLYLYLKR